MTNAAVRVDHLDYSFGKGPLRRQILYDVSCEITPGELVIFTGPSGSGKTTLLTLIGALRSPQQGSLQVLGNELCGARERDLVNVRRRIGYIFQEHNLLNCLPAWRNVEMSLRLCGDLPAGAVRERAHEAMESVGLGDCMDADPDELSVGQKQRIAVARALATRPALVLADEPTASLDRESTQSVLRLLQGLVKQHGCTVLLVTHDNRVLEIADRIVHLEDGRLVSLGDTVLSQAQQLLSLLAEDHRRGHLSRDLEALPPAAFAQVLKRITEQFEHFLALQAASTNDAFEAVLEQVLEAFTLKIGEILNADRVAVFLVDRQQRELWSKVAQDGEDGALEIRVPLNSGIVGYVAATGQVYNTPDAYEDPRFNRSVDERTGYRTRSVLCVPMRNRQGEVFAAAEVLNRRDGLPFDAVDERRFAEFSRSIGVLLESWWKMSGQMRPSQSKSPPHPPLG